MDGEGGDQEAPHPLFKIRSPQPYNDGTSDSYNFPKEDTKTYINQVIHSLSSTDISICSVEISKFCYNDKYRHRFHFNT